ncbi:MAG: hypothetical protein MUD08_02955 [Cytophagales bacterium]|nr:hypothetical protein [Cytophagales bacterium]
MKKHIKISLLIVLVTFGLVFASCERVEDPFVDRVVSPVLVMIDGAARGDYVTDPVVSYAADQPLSIGAFVYELDKTNILNNAIGIDSLPVNSLQLTLSTRTGTKIADVSTDNTGKATVSRSWEQLGIATPRRGNTVSMQWSGTHKGQAFTRYFRVQVR